VLDLEVGDVITFWFMLPSTAPEADKGFVTVPRSVRVVGLEIAPAEARPPDGKWIAAVHLTPAFDAWARAEHLRRFPGLALRLTRGATVAELRAGMDREQISANSLTFLQSDHAKAVERATEVYAVALALVAALLAIASAAILGQLLARQAVLESVDDPTLQALGLTRGQLRTIASLRAAALALAAGAVAAVTAALCSPLTPIGIARTVEPHPGLRIDPELALGMIATVGVTFALAALPAWLQIHRLGSAVGQPVRPGVTSRVVHGTNLPLPLTTGIRHALEPGRGRPAVPVRSGLAAGSLAVVGLVAALVFSASLAHLLHTPRLTGWNWDVTIARPTARNEDAPAHLDDVAAAFASNREVEAWAPGILGGAALNEPVAVNGELVTTLVLGDGAGGVEPTVTRGRAPSGADEILLGRDTIEQLGLRIGDPVDAKGPTGSRAALRVVGIGVIPTIPTDGVDPSQHRLGRGAAMTADAMHRLNRGALQDLLFVRLAPGADAHEVSDRLYEDVGPGNDVDPVVTAKAPADLLNVAEVDDLPLLLAGFMAALAIGTAIHLLISATRARRRELALLRVLGFTRGQVRRVVAWQAITESIFVLAIGIPLGVLVGRWAWQLFATNLGVQVEPLTPWTTLGILVPIALAAAVLIAGIPGWRAARRPPAQTLRSE
jgi:ABC-type lipoprotein release transport system permease subunit